MSWGDPFDKFYKDDGDVRRESIVQRGLVPGALIIAGNPNGGKPIHVWSFPDFKSQGQDVRPGLGVILGVDCESDPTDDWLMIFFNTPSHQAFGWLPTSLVKKA